MTQIPSERFKERSAIYSIIDDLNGLDTQVWKRTHSKELRLSFKRIKSSVTRLEKLLKEPT